MSSFMLTVSFARGWMSRILGPKETPRPGGALLGVLFSSRNHERFAIYGDGAARGARLLGGWRSAHWRCTGLSWRGSGARRQPHHPRLRSHGARRNRGAERSSREARQLPPRRNHPLCNSGTLCHVRRGHRAGTRPTTGLRRRRSKRRRVSHLFCTVEQPEIESPGGSHLWRTFRRSCFLAAVFLCGTALVPACVTPPRNRQLAAIAGTLVYLLK